ncbi:hypothetical protein [Fodinibius sediminis]|nr:hypothetical protein [Fodinibius sediminis]
MNCLYGAVDNKNTPAGRSGIFSRNIQRLRFLLGGEFNLIVS